MKFYFKSSYCFAILTSSSSDRRFLFHYIRKGICNAFFLLEGVRWQLLLKVSDFVRKWNHPPHAIYYPYYGETLNVAPGKGGLLGMLLFLKPGHEVLFLPLLTASALGSENRGSPVLCEVVSLLFNETDG